MAEAPLYDPDVPEYQAQVGGEAVLPPKEPAPSPDAAPASKGLVNVRSRMGEVMSLPVEQLAEAEAQGYTLETKEQKAVRDYSNENSDLTGGLKVALRGWADESSLGAQNVIEKKTGHSALSAFETDDDFSRAKHEYLAKQHPYADVIGRGLGVATSLLAGGPVFKAAGKVGGGAARMIGLGSEGAEIAARAGAYATTPATEAAVRVAAPSLAKKLARGAVVGAAEGLAGNAPVVVAEASLGDPKAAAEAAVWGLGAGAVFGVMGPLGEELFHRNTLGRGPRPGGAAAEKVAAAPSVEHAADMEVIDAYSKLPPVEHVPSFTGEGHPKDYVHELKTDLSPAKEHIAPSDVPSVTGDYAEHVGDVHRPAKGLDYTGDLKKSLSAREEIHDIVNEYLSGAEHQNPLLGPERVGMSPTGEILPGPHVSAEAPMSAAESMLSGDHSFSPDQAAALGPETGRSYGPTPKIEKPTKERGMAEELANEYAVRHVGPGKAGMKKIGEMHEDVQGVGEVARKYHAHEAAPEKHEAIFKAAKHEVGEAKDALIRPLDNLPGDGSRLALFDPQELAARVDREVGASIRADWGSEAKAGRIDKLTASILESKEKETASEAWERLRTLDDQIYGERHNLTSDRVLPELRKVRGVFKQYFDETLAEAARIHGKDPESILRKISALDTEYSALSVLSTAAKDRAAAGGANSAVSLFGYITGGISSFLAGSVGGPAAGIAGAIGGAALNKAARSHGAGLISRIAESQIPQGVATAGKAMGMVGVELDRIVPTLQMLGKNKTLPGKMPSTAALLGSMLPRHLRSDDKQENFKNLSNRLTTLTSNPIFMAKQVDAVTSALRDNAPQVADMSQSQILSIINFLAASLPRPKDPETPFSKDKWKPTDQQLADFAAKVEIAGNPFAVIDHLGRKSLTKSHVDTAQALWGKVYKAMTDRIMKYSTDPSAPVLPLTGKISLGYLMQISIDPSMDDKYKRQYQATFTKGGKGKPGPKGSPMKLPDSSTAMDRLASKGMK